MDDGRRQEEEEEGEDAFWVRGAGDAVPKAARGGAPVPTVGGGGKAKPKPKPKK